MTRSKERSRTPTDCAPRRLSDLLDGKLGQSARARVLGHLRACPACRERLGWLEQVDRFLGPVRGEHLSAEAVLAFAEGKLEADDRRLIAAHLEGCAECRSLGQAARAGLEEAQQIEDGTALLARPEPPAADCVSFVHRVIGLPSGPAARVFAATSERAAPVFEDRRVLAEEPGQFRLVYFREGGAAKLGLFVARTEEIDRLTCTVEGRSLGAAPAAEGFLFELGPVGSLPGCTLRVTFEMQGRTLGLSFTLVEE